MALHVRANDSAAFSIKKRRKKGELICISAILIVLMLSAGLLRFSAYLKYADKPVKSEVVVLFCGDDLAARQNEAASLLKEGYAHYLIVPAYNRWAALKTHCLLLPIDYDYPTGDSLVLLRKQLRYPGYFENTHFEVFEAKRIMTKYGFRSAIFVSAPYHMRRIRLIAETVFKKGENVIFVPTSFEERGNLIQRIFSRAGWAFEELVKIAWFEIYSHIFVGS